MNTDPGDTFVRYEAEGQAVEVPIERLRICGFGRSLTNAVVLSDTVASREHAMIRRNATGHCVLNDLGSTNGTFLNGRAVTTPTALASGDVIRIGRHEIAFVQTQEPANLEDAAENRTQFFLSEQLVSVLVVDVRGYTSLSAAMGPERTGQMMREIFAEAGELLTQSGCWSTKYIGDAIMALWVHASRSVSRADLMKTLDVISGYQGIFRVAEGKHRPPQPLRFGVGFNVGMASTGNLGSPGAADFTAMGEAVNTAFRLESATRQMGCDLLIAASVFEALSDARFRPPNVVDVPLKGYDAPARAVPLMFDDVGGLLGSLLESA